MILRILRAAVGHDDMPRLLALVRADIDDWARIDAGLMSAQPAWRATEDGAEFLLVSTWSHAEAVLARGGEVTLPRGSLGASGILRDGRAGHFELMLELERDQPRPAELVRLSSLTLIPRRASAFYERIRELWEQLTGDAGLIALRVGRRTTSNLEQAVVISVWESAAAVETATSGGLVGDDEMRSFYAGDATVEHFTALALPAARRAVTTSRRGATRS